MSASVADLLDSLCVYATDYLQFEAIQADQNGTRLRPPYATVKAIAVDIPLGSTDDLRQKDDGTVVRVGQRQTTISFTTYGTDAMTSAARLADSFRDFGVIDNFSEAGYAVRGIEAISDVTTLLETKFEQRANFDVHFGYVIESPANVGQIDSVKIQGVITESGSSKTHEISVTGKAPQ